MEGLLEAGGLRVPVELVEGDLEASGLRVAVELVEELFEAIELLEAVAHAVAERLSRAEREGVPEFEFEAEPEFEGDMLSLEDAEGLAVSAGEADEDGEGPDEWLVDTVTGADALEELDGSALLEGAAEMVELRVTGGDPVEVLEAERLLDQVDIAEFVGVDDADRLVVTVPVADAVSRWLRVGDPVVVGLRDRAAEFEFVGEAVEVRVARGELEPVLDPRAVPVLVGLEDPVTVSSAVWVTVKA